MRMIATYLLCLLVFLALDALWLGLIAKDFFVTQMGSLLRDDPNLAIAAVFYLVFVAGILYFAVLAGLAAGSWQVAVLDGAFLGLLAYGTYDITNLSVLKGYPPLLAAVDMAWGTCLSAVTAGTGYLAAKAMGWGVG